MSSFFSGTERFEIIRELGSGAMGVVYEARDRTTKSKVALKVLRNHLNGDAIQRFKNEFRALQDLHHENLIWLGELGVKSGRWFFSMELIKGVDFLTYAGRTDLVSDTTTYHEATDKTPLSYGSWPLAPDPATTAEEPLLDDGPGILPDIPASVAPQATTKATTTDNASLMAMRGYRMKLRSALLQLVAGLRCLHAAGKVHRDVKPSNCMVTPSGRVVLLDFGLIHDLSPQPIGPAQDKAVAGTPAYMSPEHAAGKEAGPASDMYSVGVLLYQALTGQLPLSGSWPVLLKIKQHRQPQPPSSIAPRVDPELEALCMALLAINPEDRPSADAVIEKLGGQPSPSSTMAPVFVGRHGELAQLEDAYQRSQRTATGVVISGPSGIGKSRLLNHFLHRLDERDPDVAILAGRCYQYEAVPYKGLDGVIDQVSQFLRRLPDADAAALLPRHTALLRQVFPVLDNVEVIAKAPDRGLVRDPLEMRSRTFAAVRELFAKLAERYRVVITIDDLQWANLDGMALLTEIMRPPESPPLLLLATLRAQPTADDDLVAQLPPYEIAPTRKSHNADSNADTRVDSRIDRLPMPDKDVREIALPPLPAADCRILVEQLQPNNSNWPSEIIRHIINECDGHPIFAEELIHHLAVRDINKREGEAITGFQLEDALGARLARLSADERALVELICAAQRPVNRDIAAYAAGIAAAYSAQYIRALEIAKFLRALPGRAIEPYHDRVRAAIVDGMDEQRKRHYHRGIAEAMEMRIHGDDNVAAEPLSFHWQQAGDQERSARYAGKAAVQAAEALAFERAAHLYKRALRVKHLSQYDRLQLHIGLGNALVNAGRGAEAAKAYLTAAGMSSEEKHVIDLKRRAVEHWLRSGMVQHAGQTMNELLRYVGLRLPKSQAGIKAMLLAELTGIRLRGIKVRERTESNIDRRELMRIDVNWSLAAGLTMIEPLASFIFSLRHLRLSLRAGEAFRLSRALSAYAMALVSYDMVGNARRAAELRETAADLAHRSDNAYARALVNMAEGWTLLWRGEWKRALIALDHADDTFRTECTTIEGSPISRLMALWALYNMGDIDVIRRRLPVLLRQAEERADLQAAVNLGTGVSHILALADDNPSRAHAEVAGYMRRWSQVSKRFYWQHWNTASAQIEIDLYRGHWRAALLRLESALPALAGSMLRRIQKLRIDAHYLQARCHLAAAAATAGTVARDHCQQVERAARKIEREPPAWAKPLAAMLRACLVSVRGNASRRIAADLLASAATGFARVDMNLHTDAVHRQRGILLGGEEGRTLQIDAEERIAARGIHNPGAMVAMLVPGINAGPPLK